jgi:hypothetical protein
MSSKTDKDNHSRQLNDENDAYWKARGEAGRPAPQPAPGGATPSAAPQPVKPR